MCHASWREKRHHHAFHSIDDPQRVEHPEQHRHHHHGERRACFMPHHEADRFEGRSGFGVRRPLRFLAHKLDLNEKQITELARILDELKIERAQADVDDRASLAEFADSVAGETFDAAKVQSAGTGASEALEIAKRSRGLSSKFTPSSRRNSASVWLT